MMSTCEFTAAACGVDGADRPGQSGAPRGREDRHHNFSTTQTNTTSIFTKKETFPPSSPQPNHCSLLFSPLHPLFSPPAPLQVDQLVCNELFKSLQILSVELHIIVSGPLHPERLHGALAALVQRQAVGEVDDLVLRTMDHQNG